MAGKITTGILSTAFALMITASQTAFAEEYEHQSRFDIKYSGVTIGKAVFDITFNDNSYLLKGFGRTTGLVEWISSSTGTIESAGKMIENQLAASGPYCFRN